MKFRYEYSICGFRGCSVSWAEDVAAFILEIASGEETDVRNRLNQAATVIKEEMIKAAEDYYRLLRDAPEQAQEAEDRFKELAVRFSDDPAYQALLRLATSSSKGSNVKDS